ETLTSPADVYAGISRSPGLKNDIRRQSQFRNPRFLTLHQTSALLYVADSANNVIRSVEPGDNGHVETLAGNGKGGDDDGPSDQASFNHPQGVALDRTNTLWITDSDNHTIRRIRLGVAPSLVETVAGKSGSSGFADGAGTDARFNSPTAITVETEST